MRLLFSHTLERSTKTGATPGYNRTTKYLKTFHIGIRRQENVHYILISKNLYLLGFASPLSGPL